MSLSVSCRNTPQHHTSWWPCLGSHSAPQAARAWPWLVTRARRYYDYAVDTTRMRLYVALAPHFEFVAGSGKAASCTLKTLLKAGTCATNAAKVGAPTQPFTLHPPTSTLHPPTLFLFSLASHPSDSPSF